MGPSTNNALPKRQPYERDTTMKPFKTTKSTKSTVSRSTAERGVERGLQFLRAVGTDPVIYAAMQGVGFTPSDVKQGWALVLTACSVPAVEKFNSSSGPVAEATQKIETWKATMMLRAHAALRRLHPEQDAFVFDNLEMGTGIAAVVSVSMFLQRIDALENSPDRKSTRKTDHAALATLEQRGVTKEERKQIKALIQIVESPAPVEDGAPPDARMAALTELHAWVQDWSDCARSVITRRDQLLRLGIGKRRARDTIVTPQPTPTPAPATTSLPQIEMTPIAALPPAKANGMSNGAIAIASSGGAHA